MIELPDNIDLVKFAQKVYELSKPQGLGFFNFVQDELSETDAKKFVDMSRPGYCLQMDYIRGRACKMTVFKQDGKNCVSDTWYDHTDKQYKELLQAFGVELVRDKEHGIACNCLDCRTEKGR